MARDILLQLSSEEELPRPATTNPFFFFALLQELLIKDTHSVLDPGACQYHRMS